MTRSVKRGSWNKGERKSLQTDRVRVRLGSEEESSGCRRIFHQFVVEQQFYIEIARQLNYRRVPSHDEGAWTDGKVHTILGNGI